MDAIGKELEEIRVIQDIQDEEQWAQNVQGYMRGLPKPGSMTEDTPILIHKCKRSGVRRNGFEHDKLQDSDG